MDYREFIASKHFRFEPVGFNVRNLNPNLMGFQAPIVERACGVGRFGGFLACGLGKSLCQLESGRQIVEHTNKPVLLLTPLAVSQQTKREAEKFDIAVPVKVCKTHADVIHDGINLVNYERLQLFDPSVFGGLLIDEGSIIKGLDSKIKSILVTKFRDIPFRQTWTATPAPNDYTEMGNQAEFLGIMRHTEMLATFFVNDGGDTSKWMLRGHARKSFWNWMASWAVMIQSPADIGFDAAGYDLPELNYVEHVIESEAPDGYLFSMGAKTLADQRKATRKSMQDRIARTVEIVDSLGDEPVVIWCNLNEEGTELAKAIKGSVEVAGRHSVDEKEERLMSFINRDTNRLILKAKIGGLGLNLQHCANTIIYPTHSWEQWHQMIRRFYRFGQCRPVNAHYVVSEEEMPIVHNLQRKEREADAMFSEVVEAMSGLTKQLIRKTSSGVTYYQASKKAMVPAWAS